LLARGSVRKESSIKNAAKLSSKPANGSKPFSTEPRPEHEFTAPKFAWNIGHVAVTALNDGDGTSVEQAAASAIVHEVLSSPGQLLDAAKRTSMEPGYSAGKLAVAPVNGAAEQEAVRFSERVTGGGFAGGLRAASSNLTGSGAPYAAPPQAREALGSPSRPLEASARRLFERRLGHDFSNVRVHTDVRATESAASVGAKAYTVGRDIVFGRGMYAPDTKAGKGLLAHELVHVAQQGGGTTLLARAPDAASPAANPKLKHVYRMSHVVPSTGQGLFNEVEYNSEMQIFTITIRPHFDFLGMNVNDYPAESRSTPVAQEALKETIRLKKEAFIGSFVAQAEAWSGHHTFFCHEPGLESLRATVRVDVDLSDSTNAPSTDTNYFHVNVKDENVRDATGRSSAMMLGLESGLGQSEYDPKRNVMIPKSIRPPLDLRGVGERGATPDLLGVSRPGLVENGPKMPKEQLVLMHETGHLFGLGDEYVEEGKPAYARGMQTEHSALAQSMLGQKVAHGDNPQSIMAGGNEILPQHGVTFLEALRKVTNLRWEFQPKK